MGRSTRRICQRANQIKNGSNSYFFSNTCYIAHRPLGQLRKKKTDTNFLDTSFNIGCGNIKIHSQVGQYICSSEIHGSRPISMPGYFYSCPGNDKYRCCRNIKCACTHFACITCLKYGFSFNINIIPIEI